MTSFLHNGPAEDLRSEFHGCDVLICDPPYRAHVHEAATSCGPAGTTHRDLGFAHLSPELRALIGDAASAVKRWSIIYTDVESVGDWRKAVTCAEYLRVIPWIRWSMPQLTGDRPPQGWEALCLFHSPGRKHWNGAGNLMSLEHHGPDAVDLPALEHKCLRGDEKYKAEKPLDQALDLVSWFSDPLETVLDLTAGVGTFGVACALLGRTFVGAEVLPDVHARAEQRITAAERGELSPRDKERFTRWVESTVAQDMPTTKPGQKRHAARLADVELALERVK